MISIKDRKILGQIFSHYDYVMTTAQLSKEKLYYRDVQRMLEAGLIERIKRGYYHWAAGSGKGDVVIISRLFPDGILCMETALFYYGYSDRNPAEWNIPLHQDAQSGRHCPDRSPEVKRPLYEVPLSGRNHGQPRNDFRNRYTRQQFYGRVILGAEIFAVRHSGTEWLAAF